jgi:hypothetical protein
VSYVYTPGRVLTIRTYSLEIIQQPQRARACGFGDKVSHVFVNMDYAKQAGPTTIISTADTSSMGP